VFDYPIKQDVVDGAGGGVDAQAAAFVSSVVHWLMMRRNWSAVTMIVGPPPARSAPGELPVIDNFAIDDGVPDAALILVTVWVQVP